jgi:Transposase DDE domain.
VLNGIWYVLWTGCQWKAVHRDWFGVCSSTLHQRFQEWQRSGIFLKLMMLLVRFYARRQGIGWLWQAIDSKSCPAPLGGTQTGKSPVDRSKRGSKIHLLVDERGAPLAVCVTGANIHDKWLADDLIISIVIPRPDPEGVEQHVCMDKGYDYPDVHQFVELARYIGCIRIWGQDQAAAHRWSKCSPIAAERKTIMRLTPGRDQRIPAPHSRCLYCLTPLSVVPEPTG